MDSVSIRLDEPEVFDQCVREGLPEGQDVMIVSKTHATVGHKTAVCITWTVQLPDGSTHRVQAVMTEQLFQLAAAALRGREEYRRGEEHRHGRN